ncbi:MAG: high light inducible protein [Acaryochloridaceae cyanobacterium RL_2_7]|nr:high light inducible protein [Acaryochloridaceae cyanobacterium RL_2_7]
MTKLDASTPSPDSVEVTQGDVEEPSFGWNPYSELVNGRLAMLAVLGLVLLEWFTKQDLFTWLGFR